MVRPRVIDLAFEKEPGDTVRHERIVPHPPHLHQIYLLLYFLRCPVTHVVSLYGGGTNVRLPHRHRPTQ